MLVFCVASVDVVVVVVVVVEGAAELQIMWFALV